MRHSILVLAAIWLWAPVALGQTVPIKDPFLEHLAGNWVLRGTIAGKQTTHDISADWILGHEYLRIQERSREIDSLGVAQYEALVLIGWDAASSQYQCMWLDTTGGGGLSSQSIGLGKRDGNAIPFLFKERDGAVSFVNTFSYDEARGSWVWNMENVKNGARVPFARLQLTLH